MLYNLKILDKVTSFATLVMAVEGFLFQSLFKTGLN